MATQTWSVYTLDVWGNESDGYDVNDRSNVGKVEIDTDADDKAIIKTLVDAGYLRPRFRFAVDGDDCFISIDHAATGRPVLQLQRDNA